MKNRRREEGAQAGDEQLARVRGEELLVQLAARADLAKEDSPFYTDERFVSWLDAEVNSAERRGEG